MSISRRHARRYAWWVPCCFWARCSLGGERATIAVCYAPNSYGGPRADPQRYRDPSWFVEAAEIMRTAYMAHKDDNDFIQPGMLYRQVMSPTDRDHLVGNIVWHLSQGVERFIQERAVKSYFYPVDPDLGARVAKGLGLEVTPKSTVAG